MISSIVGVVDVIESEDCDSTVMSMTGSSMPPFAHHHHAVPWSPSRVQADRGSEGEVLTMQLVVDNTRTS